MEKKKAQIIRLVMVCVFCLCCVLICFSEVCLVSFVLVMALLAKQVSHVTLLTRLSRHVNMSYMSKEKLHSSQSILAQDEIFISLGTK